MKRTLGAAGYMSCVGVLRNLRRPLSNSSGSVFPEGTVLRIRCLTQNGHLIGGNVVRSHMVDTPTLCELPEVSTGERRFATSPESERNTNFLQNIRMTQADVVSELQGTTIGQPESLSSITRKNFPATWKSRMAGLQYLA